MADSCDVVCVAHLGWDAFIIGVMVPVFAIVTVLQGERGDKHLFPHRLGSLCYNPSDLLDLPQLDLKPLAHVIVL